MRLAYYAGVSTAAAAACLLKAFHQRPNFYSATVYLSQSNACLLILTNLLLVMACSFIYGLQRLLYGPLRPIEIEQLSEKAWYAVLDTLLAMPNFREDVGGWLLAMFTLLLAGKVWGWIGEGRVDILEQQPPANPTLFHLRLTTSLVLSVVFDLWMLNYCIDSVLIDPRPGMMVIFTFEFAILSVFSLFTLSRYVLNVLGIRIEHQQLQSAIQERKAEIRAERAAARQSAVENGDSPPADSAPDAPIDVDENEVDVPGWEDKRRYLFALEVFTDFVKLLIYIAFFIVSITFNGLPMHIMRDVYMTFASFSKRVSDFIAYRKATSDMNTRYPDATTEEIRGDSCIVCRETMVAWGQSDAQQGEQPAEQQPDAAATTPTRRRDEGLRAKKLPCGHILHLRCLKAWLERQQVCPTCRRPVVAAADPAQPTQPGAVPLQPQANDQQPPAPPRRQNRARVFNLGPVRIGLLNGPEDQIGNIVRQIQNPNAPAPNVQNAAAANHQHAANPPPYNNPAAAAPPQPFLSGLRSSRQGSSDRSSVQHEIMSLEERLVREVHNLGLEQQQLEGLRLLEGELARLRALSRYPQQPVGITAPSVPSGYDPSIAMQAYHAQVDVLEAHNRRRLMLAASGELAEQEGQSGQERQQQTQNGPENQQQIRMGHEVLSSGHESLPPGLVLPQGWSVMPLHPTEQPMPNGLAERVHINPMAHGGPNFPYQSLRAPNPGPSSSAAGPTDDTGSPLFVPTASLTTANSNSTSTLPTPPGPASSSSAVQSVEDDESDDHGSSECRLAASWAFDDLDEEHTVNGDEQTNGRRPSELAPRATTTSRSANNHSNTSTERRRTAASNNESNKPRSAEVEDAPDPGT